MNLISTKLCKTGDIGVNNNLFGGIKHTREFKCLRIVIDFINILQLESNSNYDRTTVIRWTEQIGPTRYDLGKFQLFAIELRRYGFHTAKGWYQQHGTEGNDRSHMPPSDNR